MLHGSYVGEAYEAGDSITLVCDDGFERVSGDMVRHCLKNGTWSGVLPTCKGMLYFISTNIFHVTLEIPSHIMLSIR